MNINFHQRAPLEGEIVIELTEEDYMPSVAESIRTRRTKTDVKGFRRGQAPASMIQKMYGPEILLRTTLDLAIKNLNSYLQDHTLHLLQDPIMVDNTLYAADHVDIAHPGIIEIKFVCGLKPEIDLSSLHQIEIDQFEIKSISDASIMDVIQRVQTQHGTTQEVMQAEPGDMIYTSLTPTTESTQAIYLPAAGMKIGKQDISFVGLQPHDKLTLHFSPELPYTLPNTQTHYQETTKLLDRLTGTYEAAIEKIYRPVLAELDQDFFLKIFPHHEVTTLDELKDKVKDILTRHAQVEADNLLMNKLKQAVLTHLSFELPENFIKKGLKTQFPKWNEETIEAYYRLYTQNSLRWSLIAEKMIQEYDIHVSTIEVAQYLQLTSHGSHASLEALSKKIEQSFAIGNPDKSYQDAYHWATEAKVLNALKTKVNLHIQEKTVEEFNTFVADRSHHHDHDHPHSHEHHHADDHHCSEC